MNQIAQWIGYAVMTAAGLLAAVALLTLALERWWDGWKKGLNARDLRDALQQWRERHPERWAENVRRQGGEPL